MFFMFTYLNYINQKNKLLYFFSPKLNLAIILVIFITYLF